MTSEDTYPPGHVPADGDRTGQAPAPPESGRYSASASVPVPLAGQVTSATYGMPAGVPTGYEPGHRQPVQQTATPFDPSDQPPTSLPPAGQPGTGQSATAPLGQAPAAGQGRVTATASVPPPSFAAGQGPGAYPSQGVPGGAGAPAPPVSQGTPAPGFPSQSPPAPSLSNQPGTYGQPGGTQFGGFGSPAQPREPGSFGQPGLGSFGQPGAGSLGQPGPGPMSQPTGYPPHGYAPGPDPTRPAPVVAAGGWPPEQPVPDRRRRGVLIAVIVVAALIVVGGVGGIAWALANRSTPYRVGACVVQDGGSAKIVDCGSSGAFRITSIVDNESQCQDPAKPVLILTGAGKDREVACLTEAI